MNVFEFLGSLDAAEYSEIQMLMAEPWPVDEVVEVEYGNAAAFEEMAIVEDEFGELMYL